MCARVFMYTPSRTHLCMYIYIFAHTLMCLIYIYSHSYYVQIFKVYTNSIRRVECVCCFFLSNKIYGSLLVIYLSTSCFIYFPFKFGITYLETIITRDTHKPPPSPPPSRLPLRAFAPLSPLLAISCYI